MNSARFETMLDLAPAFGGRSGTGTGTSLLRPILRGRFHG